MKKLNRKGFTLIELLAIIVILAIIMVVAIPNVLSSIDNARKSTLNSEAKAVANWYTEGVAMDEISLDGTVTIGSAATILNANKGKWFCLSHLTTNGNGIWKTAVIGTTIKVGGKSVTVVEKSDNVTDANTQIVGSGTTTLFDAFGLSDADFVKGTKTSAFANLAMPKVTSGTLTTTTCSAISVSTAGKVQVLLVANPTGRFQSGSDVNYSFSHKDKANLAG